MIEKQGEIIERLDYLCERNKSIQDCLEDMQGNVQDLYQIKEAIKFIKICFIIIIILIIIFFYKSNLF